MRSDRKLNSTTATPSWPPSQHLLCLILTSNKCLVHGILPFRCAMMCCYNFAMGRVLWLGMTWTSRSGMSSGMSPRAAHHLTLGRIVFLEGQASLHPDVMEEEAVQAAPAHLNGADGLAILARHHKGGQPLVADWLAIPLLRMPITMITLEEVLP